MFSHKLLELDQVRFYQNGSRLLVFACILSGILGEWVEAFAIAAILSLNALIGFSQEYRAETAIQALKGMTSPKAKVIRNGRHHLLEATEIVPDDLLVLEAGDLVAADGRILESARLQINEAVLTGESVPVEKNVHGLDQGDLAERAGMVFMGTAVSSGTAIVETTSTGMATELGKIAHLINTAEVELTPLQKQMIHVGKMLLILCLAVVILVLTIRVFQERPWLDLIVFSISLAVAAVPEGLPAIVTVALAHGRPSKDSRSNRSRIGAGHGERTLRRPCTCTSNSRG